MTFHSFLFLLFFPVVFGVYWRLPERFRVGWLLIISYVFIASWSIPALMVLLFLTVGIHLTSRRLEKAQKHKKRWLGLGLGLLLGSLLVFKYFNFLSAAFLQLAGLAHWQISLPTINWLLPIGISFYTFQMIGYLLDVYWGKVKAEPNFFRFALFTGFFPKFIAGPIERATSLLPQIGSAKKLDPGLIESGLKLFAYGLFKKLVIADNLSLAVDKVFGNLGDWRGLSLWLALWFYSWQIYADFSGYTDMARGTARMLGYQLLPNFNTPYLATSLRDFWRRWHISLSTWLKDYLYIPLGGSRGGNLKTAINTLIVFLLCGLWHGAAWTFVWWGGFHGIVLVIERVVGGLPLPRFRLPTWLSILYTNFIVGISWIFFRSETVADVEYIFSNVLVGIKNIISPTYVWATLSQMFRTNRLEMGITLSAMLMIIGLEILTGRQSLGQWINRQKAPIRWTVYAGMGFLILMLRNAEIKEFIYIQF